MVNYRKNSTVSVGLLKILNAYANRLGVDFKKVARFCDFDIRILDNCEASVSSKFFESMWLRIVSLSKDPYPGLNFGRQMAKHYPGGSILFTMMMNCATIEKALQVFVRYHRIMADIIQPQFQKTREVTHLLWEISTPEFHTQSHLAEAFLCTYYSILNFLSQGELTLIKVCFTHVGPSDPVDRNEYQRVFNAPVLFEENKNELIIETESLDIKIDLANQELYKVLERHATQIVNTMPKEKKWSNKVLSLISDMILKGDIPNIESISRKLAVSKRSLQEKLKVEETSFRNLRETIRKQMAIDNLAKQDVSICEVAFMLGYSDQSAFNHAFKRWTGQTPKAYIRK
jgi:AraC-like DNA-binding protein